MSLLEIMIAMAMLVVVVALAMDALLNAKGLAKNLDDNETIEDDIRRLKQVVGGDLANTGWFQLGLVTDSTPALMYPQVHFGYRSAALGLTSPLPLPTGAPSTQEDIHVLGLDSTPAKLLSADALYFMKIRSSATTSTNPQTLRISQINLNGVDPTPLNSFAVAPPADDLIFNSSPTATFQPWVSPVWESHRTGLTWAQNAQPANLRIYRYHVVPDPLTGNRTGILMKSYVNGPVGTLNNSWNWVDAGEICRDIVSLTFDSNLTDPSLARDQIRVKAVFLREGTRMGNAKTDLSSNQHSRRQRTFEGTFALRSLP